VITDLAEVQALRGTGDGFADVDAAIRLFAPGEGEVGVTVTVTSQEGADTGLSFEADLEAGRVMDFPIEELDTGNYTVTITSTAPVVGAVRATTALGPVTDFAWFTSAAELSGDAQFTVAPGPVPVLHLVNPTESDVVVQLQELGGDSVSVTVSAASSVIVPVSAASTYRLSGFDVLYAALSFAADGSIAGYAVEPPGVGSAPVTVYP